MNKIKNLTNIQKLYLIHGLDSFSDSFVGIFIPIYLLTIGFSIPRMILFFAVTHVSGLLLTVLIIKLSQKYGVIHIWRYRVIFRVLYLLLITLLNFYTIPWIPIAILGGANIFWYWIPFNILSAKNLKEGHSGKLVANIKISSKIASIIAPILTVLFIFLKGFWVSFIIAALITIVQFFIMNKIDEMLHTFDFSFKNVKNILKENKKYFIGEVFENSGKETDWLWPIVTFLQLGTIASVGAVGVLLNIGVILSSLMIGRSIDKNSKTLATLLKVGAFINAMIWILRYFVNTNIQIYLITILAGITSVLFALPFNALMFQRTQTSGLEMVLVRELPVVLGRIILFSLVILFSNNPSTVFLFAGLSYLYFIFVNVTKEKPKKI